MSLQLLLILVLVLSACGGGGSDGPELARRVSLVEGFVRLQVPENWLADDDGRTVFFASSQEGLSGIESDLQSLSSIVADLPTNSQVGVMFLTEAVLGNTSYTPGSLLQDQFGAQGSPFPPGLIRETRINGREAAIAPIEFTDTSIGGVLAVVDWQGVVVTLVGVWTADSDGSIADTFEAILAQMELDVGGLTQD